MKRAFLRESQLLDKHNTVEKLFLEFEKGVTPDSIPKKLSQSLLVGNTRQSNKTKNLNTQKHISEQAILSSVIHTKTKIGNHYTKLNDSSGTYTKYSSMREKFIDCRSKNRSIAERYYLNQPIGFFFDLRAERTKAIPKPIGDSLTLRLRRKVLRLEVGSKLAESLHERSLGKKVEQALESARKYAS